MTSLLWLLLSMLPIEGIDAGALSVYRAGDGYNAGELACGGAYTDAQEHVAIRDWRMRGCGRVVLVCTLINLRCAATTVRDAGPWGVIRGSSWRKSVSKYPPPGWRWRAATDLSYGLWKKLGRPRPLTGVVLIYLDAEVSDAKSSS